MRKTLAGVLVVLLLTGSFASYRFLLFPVEGAWAQEGESFSDLLPNLAQQSFLRAQLPSLNNLRQRDPCLATATLERYYPFTLGLKCTHYPVVWKLRVGEKTWELLSSGDLVPGTGDATISATIAVLPLSHRASAFLLDLASALDAQFLRDQVRALAVEADDRIIVELTDGMQLFFLADAAVYKRHLPSLKLYLGKARQEGKKELHFEFNDVVG